MNSTYIVKGIDRSGEWVTVICVGATYDRAMRQADLKRAQVTEVKYGTALVLEL